MAQSQSRSRRLPDPPSGFGDHLSRRDAARVLGFASEFKVRQLEKQGRLHPVRGAMGQAWYPRSEILALRRAPVPLPGLPDERGPGAGPGRDAGPLPAGRAVILSSATGRLSDAALIAHLREPADAQGRPRTVVDLVADTGVSIARAERVYRFWLAHDLHPVAAGLRRARGANAASPVKPNSGAARLRSGARQEADSDEPFVAGPPGTPSERRGGERIERDTLIRQLRHADPAVRARAFERLKGRRGPT